MDLEPLGWKRVASGRDGAAVDPGVDVAELPLDTLREGKGIEAGAEAAERPKLRGVGALGRQQPIEWGLRGVIEPAPPRAGAFGPRQRHGGLTRRPFGAIVQRLTTLPVPAGQQRLRCCQRCGQCRRWE
ncbi:MAG TPA: hypothetical protein VN822_01225 [Candidatus Acidoferrales bacterium]|nr:hypothetical protein [Candidatus Acidoferrales bacterium]